MEGMATAPPPRWQLTGPLPVLWRSDGSVQLGLEPPAGLVLSAAAPGVREVLDALSTPQDRRSLLLAGGRHAERWLDGLLSRLQGAGLVRSVHPAGHALGVIGTGRLPVLLTRVLLAATDAAVRLACPGAAVEPRAVRALRQRHPDRLRFAGQWTDAAAAPDLTVLAVQAAEPERSLLTQLMAAGRPFLVVRACDVVTGVGPLVVPGRAACPRCEDLHRTARDPAWPQLLAQLCRRRAPPGAAELHWAAGTAALHVSAFLAGTLPDSTAACLELGDDKQLRLRPLRPHPGCSCAAAA